jgi:hypothetical protein
MTARPHRGVLLAVLLVAATPAAALEECDRPPGPGPRRCLYRAALPAAGVVAECRGPSDCRVGAYFGDPEDATWFEPPPGWPRLPVPAVTWHTPTFGEARFAGPGGRAVSYFVDARRRRLSPARPDVLAVAAARQLVAAAEDAALVVRHVFSGRELLRLERAWAPGPLPAAVVSARFEPDGRLALTWLRGPQRTPVSERVTVPPRPPR